MPRFSNGSGGPARPSIGPQGLPLIKPAWGRITAIDFNIGDHVWMIANGDAPDAVKNHPLMKGIDLKATGARGAPAQLVALAVPECLLTTRAEEGATASLGDPDDSLFAPAAGLAIALIHRDGE